MYNVHTAHITYEGTMFQTVKEKATKQKKLQQPTGSLDELTASIAVLALRPVLGVPLLKAVPLLVAAQVHTALLAPHSGAVRAARHFARAAD
jgi:phosphoribosylcarboxyaminoimidazole (NCAIR) mutase